MSIEITVDMGNTLGRLAEIANNIEGGQGLIEQLSDQMVELMVTEAMMKVPVDTGNLMSSIHYEGSFPNYRLVADATNMYTGDAYAQYVEFGTSMQEAQPFMWPAVYSSMNIYLPIIKREFRTFILGK